VVSEDTFAQECEPSANEIVVFTEPNFQGECRKYIIGSSPLPVRKEWNNSISSIKVGAKVKVWMCQDIHFEGICEQLTRSDRDLKDNKVGDNQISSFSISLKNAPKDDSSIPIDKEAKYLVTKDSVGYFKIGMTVGEAEKVLNGMEFRPVPMEEGEGMAIGVFEGDKEQFVIGSWGSPEFEKDSDGNPIYMDSNGKRLEPKLPPFDKNQIITFIGIADPRYKTAEGVHIGMTIADAEKKYGKAVLTKSTDAHVGEVGEFTNAPKYLGFAFKASVYDTVGVYGEVPNCGEDFEPECRKTNKYNPGSYISAMWVDSHDNSQ
jgi:hypothetical protein